MNGIHCFGRWSAVALVAAALASCTQRPVQSSASPVAELAGRTAGPPQRCVTIQPTEALRLGADRVLLYGRGRTLWVNRLGERCTGIDRGDILIVEPVGASYCRGDRVRSLDPISRVPGPGCILGDFVPYRR